MYSKLKNILWTQCSFQIFTYWLLRFFTRILSPSLYVSWKLKFWTLRGIWRSLAEGYCICRFQWHRLCTGHTGVSVRLFCASTPLRPDHTSVMWFGLSGFSGVSVRYKSSFLLRVSPMLWFVLTLISCFSLTFYFSDISRGDSNLSSLVDVTNLPFSFAGRLDSAGCMWSM